MGSQGIPLSFGQEVLPGPTLKKNPLDRSGGFFVSNPEKKSD